MRALLLLALLCGARTAAAGFADGYPRFKQRSHTETSAIVLVKLDRPDYGKVQIGCAVIADAVPGSQTLPGPTVAPNLTETLLWRPFHLSTPILYAQHVNTTSDPELEILLVLSPSKHLERDFEVYCAHDGMTTAEATAEGHLHLQLVSFTGTYTWGWNGLDLVDHRNPDVVHFQVDNVHPSTGELFPQVGFETDDDGRAKLLDVRLRTVWAEKSTWSVTLVQTVTSDPVFLGFTDDTTFWGFGTNSRTVWPMMETWEEPFLAATGSSLNHFGVFELVNDFHTITVNVTFSRVDRSVEMVYERGSDTLRVAPPVNARSRFPGGPMRCVVNSMNDNSKFRFFSLDGAVVVDDDPAVYTMGWDYDGLDMTNAAAPGSAPSTVAFTGAGDGVLSVAAGAEWTPFLVLPMRYSVRDGEHFSFTLTYYGQSQTTPTNRVELGLTNSSRSWTGGRLWTVLRGGLLPDMGTGTPPVQYGAGQTVISDDEVPFDAELYVQCGAACGPLSGVLRTRSGWTTWSYPLALAPSGGLDVLAVMAEPSPQTETVPRIRVQLSAVDQYRPWVYITTNTQMPVANRSETIMATFNEPVSGFGNDSILLTNAYLATVPVPSTDFQAVEWVFEITPMMDGFVTVQILEHAFNDTNGYSNTDRSNQIVYIFDSVQPVVDSFTTSLPDPFLGTFGESYVNQSFLAALAWDAVYNEEPFTHFTAELSVQVENGFARDAVAVDRPGLPGAAFRFFVTAASDGEVRVRLPRGSVEDQGGNTAPATRWVSFQYDSTIPFAVITAPLPRYTSQVVLAATTFTIAFSEPMPTFSVADFEVINGEAFNGVMTPLSNWTVFTFNVRSTIADGWVNVTMPYFGTVDRAQNGILPTHLAFEFDETFPQVVLTSDVRFPTNKSVVPFNATFTELLPLVAGDNITVLTGFADVTDTLVSGSRLETFVTAFSVMPTAEGNVSVFVEGGAVVDFAVNPVVRSVASGSPHTNPAGDYIFLYDSIPPEVVISTATRLAAVNPTNRLRTFVATFSEFVEFFQEEQVNVTGGTPVNMRQLSDTVYNFDVAPTATDGPITVHVDRNVTIDVALNGVLTSNTVAVHYDAVPPAVRFFSANDDNPLVDISQFTIDEVVMQLSEAVVEPVTPGLVTVLNANISTFTQIGPLTWAFHVVPFVDNAVISVQMLEGTIHDPADNHNTPSTVDDFGNIPRPLAFQYSFYFDPGWPLWLKLAVTLGPLTCCLCCIGWGMFCWLKLPPLERIDSDEEEDFDHVKAIETLKAIHQDETFTLKNSGGLATPVKFGDAESELGIQNPLPIGQQLPPSSKTQLAAFTSRRTRRQRGTESRAAGGGLVFDSPRSIRSGSVAPSPRVPKPGEPLNSPTAWGERKASPVKQYHDATEVHHV